MSKYITTGDQQWYFCNEVGLTTIQSCPRVGAGLSLPVHCCPSLRQGLFQGCLWVVAIEKEAVPSGQVGWAQQSLWTPFGYQWWTGTSAGPDGSPAGPYNRHIFWLTPASLPNGLGLDLWPRSRIPSSPSPRLHHHLVSLGTGDGVGSLSLSLCIFILTYHDVINCNPDFPRAFPFNS